MADRAVAAADRRGEPGPRRQLARRAEPADVSDLGEDDQRGERADAGKLGEHLNRGLGSGPLVHLPVQPVDRLLQGVDERQVVLDYLAGDGWQFQRGQPGPALAGPAAARPVLAMVGEHGVDPVA